MKSAGSVANQELLLRESAVPGKAARGDGVSSGTSPASVGLLAGVLVLTVGVVWSYYSVAPRLVRIWISNPDYSHGFLVPGFAAFLLWSGRCQRPGRLPDRLSPGELSTGLLLMLWGGALSVIGGGVRILAFEAFSLLPALLGIVVLCGGWQAARWALPSVAFLVFMIPIPPIIAGLASSSLQQIATAASTYTLQTLGIPAVAEGNIIWLSQARIGVAEACSGLPMLMCFGALAMAVCLLVRRPLWEKTVVLLSAPLVAVTANVVRISATGFAYECADERFASLIFHDLAGWLMMPLAVLLLGTEVLLLSRLFIRTEAVEILPSRLQSPSGSQTRSAAS